MTYRMLKDWAKANAGMLAIGDILTAQETYAIIETKYCSWRSTFTVSDDDPAEKDNVINMLWTGFVSTSLPRLQSTINALSALTGKKEYQKKIDGTLTKTGDTTRTPNLTDKTTNSAYADTTTNTSYTETGETINSSVAYSTLAEKEREKTKTTNTVPERDTTTNFGENSSTINRTGTETSNRNLTDKNDVVESGFETSPELIKDSVEYANKQPVYDFIDKFVHQFFTI